MDRTVGAVADVGIAAQRYGNQDRLGRLEVGNMVSGRWARYCPTTGSVVVWGVKSPPRLRA